MNFASGAKLPGGGENREYSGYTVFFKEGSIPILQKSLTFPLLNTRLFIQIHLLKYNLKNIFLKRKILPRILPFSLAYMHKLIYKVVITVH